TAPIGFVVGAARVSRRLWTRSPGYILGAITIAFGVLAATQACATVNWIEGRPAGVGDPDGEFVMAVFAVLSGAFTTFVGVVIVFVRRGLGAPQGSSVQHT
ncbi:hypothetical protein, partial [Nonomuraea sp. bgisy101]|uniref:hypothetical protein n=1 Tax=Nonomuraea sp. bgisy101 TaxID=3413784 RepID=UPI003D715E73